MCKNNGCSDCKCKGKPKATQFSNFSLLGICFDQQCKKDKIVSDCNKIWEGGDQQWIDDCIAEGNAGMSTSGSPGLGASLNTLLNVLGIGNHTGNTGTTQSNTPPPDDKKLVLGMDPLVATGVIIGGTGLLIWGISIMLKKKAA